MFYNVMLQSTLDDRHCRLPSSDQHIRAGQQPIGPHFGDTFAEVFPRCLAFLRASRQVIPYIPRGAREDCARVLARLMNQAVDANTPHAWAKFLSFPYGALSVSDKKEQGPSLTSKLRAAINTYNDATDLDFIFNTPAPAPRDQPNNPEDALSRIVTRKMNDFDIRGALRVLTSEKGLAPPTDDTVAALRTKHPPASSELLESEFPPGSDFSLHTELEVSKAVSSFPPGSSGGLDGLRPAHLQLLMGFKVGEAGASLKHALTKLMNFLIRGAAPDFILGALFGGSLCALEKENADVRPIVVGSTYRRLAVKVALRPLTSTLGGHFSPIQLGFGCSGGCEAAAHATRSFYRNLTHDNVLVK